MSTTLIKSLLEGHRVQINSKFYLFDFGGKLTISCIDDPIYGEYEIISKNNYYYLKTNPSILEDTDEILISILLGNCENGILINNFK